MAQLFDPSGDGKRLHAPASMRNRDVIFDVLSPKLKSQPTGSLIFEIASGTGEHAAYMAPKLPRHLWQPSDIDSQHIASIDAWRHETAAQSVQPARHFNILKDSFHAPQLPAPLAVIMAVNLLHISPWVVAETLMEKACPALPSGGLLYLYGPYKRGGAHTAESNAQFDASLKSRDSSWGIRDMESVIDCAESAGFRSPEITPMPANNFSLVFAKV